MRRKLLFGFVVLVSCSPKEPENNSDKETKYSKQYKILNQDTICNIIKKDTLETSYFVKFGKANGIFQTYKSGKLFSNGLMIDSLKNDVWKYYNIESGSLDSVTHFYNDKRVFTLDKNDFNLKRRKLEYSDVEINVPSDWIVKENYEGTLFAVIKTQKENGFKPNVTLIREKNKQMSFENYCKTAIALSLNQFSNSKIIESKYIKIDKDDAKKVIFTGNISNNMVGSIIIIVNHNDTFYIFTGSAANSSKGDFLRYKGLFEEMIYSALLPDVKV